MKIFVGETRSPALLERMSALGWGRIFVDRLPRPRPGEMWALDNGAFVCWKNGLPFPEARFRRNLGAAIEHATPPRFAVLPDIVGAGAQSLAVSLAWLDEFPTVPWYLAIQNGMSAEDVAPVLPRIDGLFLGGDEVFKATAPRWSALAHAHGRRFHYARASTPAKLRLAYEAGADSCDSSFPLWTSHRWRRFELEVAALEGQMPMPWLRRGETESLRPAVRRPLRGFLRPKESS